MYAVIMAGGQGTRLWPLSRSKKPKQLHSLVSDKSLIRETFDRLTPKLAAENIFISTTPDYQEEIRKHLPELPEENYIIEPFPMGTAAACGLATKIIAMRDSEAITAFLPADHTVIDNKAFLETLLFGGDLCQDNQEHIITIGINPTRPDTGLGYIKIDSQFAKKDEMRAFTVDRFIEKPDIEKARQYVQSWEYLWNAGIFIWKNEEMLKLFKEYLPDSYRAFGHIATAWETPERDSTLKAEYTKVEQTSIDYGIMEKTNKILVVPADFGWSDVGSWGSLLEVLSQIHNADFISRGHHIGVGNSNSLVLANDKLIATVGLKDIVVVDTPDALLICNSKQSHEVKDLLGKLKAEGKHLYL